MTRALGIDFGTSTTVAATCENGEVSIVRGAAGDEITPSCVAFMPDGKITVGRVAKNRRIIDPANTLFSFKRIIGRKWTSSDVKLFVSQYPFTLERGGDDQPRFVTRAGKLSAADVTTYLLATLRETEALKEITPGTRVTLTVPVSFRDEQRAALITAAAGAGFRDVALLEEPCAAAYACLGPEDKDKTVAVYDLGGGTFDMTVLHWDGEQFKVLGMSGDSYLGGDDITAQCADWVSRHVLEEHHWNIGSSAASWQKLLVACDNAKIQLSTTEQQVIPLTGIDEVLKDKTVTLTSALLEVLCADLVRRTFSCCDEALRNANITARNIQKVILSGGCGHIGFVRKAIEGYFGQAPFVKDPPDKVVAWGAAIHAARRT